MAGLHENDKRTVWLVNKPYHWIINDNNRLSLVPGPSPTEEDKKEDE